MTKMRLTVVVLTACLFVQYAESMSSTCAVDPPCGCSYGVVMCPDKGLTAVPGFVPTHIPVFTVKLSANNISHVEDFAFANLTASGDIAILLDNNPIERIDDLAFEGLQNARVSLLLQGTRLRALPKALKLLKHLFVLVVDLPLDPDVMAKIGPSLQSLTVNKITEWPSSLRYASHLEGLTVSGNRKVNLPQDAFAGLERSLLYLTISDLRLTKPPQALCSLGRLSMLHLLSMDVPSGVSAFPDCNAPLRHVVTVDLKNTTLTSLPSLLPLFPGLKFLHLINTDLGHISGELSLPNVRAIDLTNNSLSQIPPVIRGLDRLDVLTLTRNNITTIDTKDFHNLRELSTLYIAVNPISKVAADAFNTNIKLLTVSLAHTNLTTVPKAIPHFRNLWLYLMGTPIQCSCNLAWLRPAVTSHRLRITGTCLPDKADLASYISTHTAECQVQPIG